ncbi:hypothetical protein U27_01080 [Candidatus Vecturithrix granuli]|uniref:DUF2914 domain-containing protein n=1 Tax=Vecturithrix granuli TaxID=1499967 RepID=A0A081C9C6_VECG1|nr:hypothetical protein U27_01080 [Candidatus Vecturithrix granuli]
MIELFLSIKVCKRFLFCVCLLLLGYLSGCGGGDDGIGERLSGPGSDAALPIRIDATVTPTSTPTPESELFPEEDPPNDAASLSPTLLSEEGLISPTPTSSLALSSEKDVETELSKSALPPTPLPRPTPTPTLTPTPTPTAKAQAEREDTSADRSLKPPKGSNETSETSEKNSSGKQAKSEPEQNSQKTAPKEEIEPEQEPESEQSKDQEETQTDDEQANSSEAVVNSSAIRLDRVVICSKITDRNPVNVTSKFSLSEVGKIYTWMQVSGVKPPKTVKHIYYREGKIVARVTLKLRYASMRTWSEKTFKPEESVGKWKVIVTTENEKEVLALREFTITP